MPALTLDVLLDARLRFVIQSGITVDATWGTARDVVMTLPRELTRALPDQADVLFSGPPFVFTAAYAPGTLLRGVYLRACHDWLAEVGATRLERDGRALTVWRDGAALDVPALHLALRDHGHATTQQHTLSLAGGILILLGERTREEQPCSLPYPAPLLSAATSGSSRRTRAPGTRSA